MLIRKFKAPVYGSKIWIVVGDNMLEAIEMVEDHVNFRIFEEEERRHITAFAYPYLDNYTFHIIIIVKHNAPPGDIAHEALHAVNRIFQYHGVRRSRSNDEHECYYLDMLVAKIHNAIKAFKKRYKKNL